MFNHLWNGIERLAELSENKTTIAGIFLYSHMHEPPSTSGKCIIKFETFVLKNKNTLTYFSDKEKSCLIDSLFLTRKLPSRNTLKTFSASTLLIDP